MNAFMRWFDEAPARTAIGLFVLFIILSAVLAALSITVPKPLDWLEAWLKVFQTVVSIVVLLKIVWNFPAILSALAKLR